MQQDWRRGDTFIGGKPSLDKSKYNVHSGGIGNLNRIPDTNKKKRDENAEFFAQEKLLIEYWVSFEVTN